MKRVWRFVKWCFAGMSSFEWYLLSISFSLGAGITALAQGNEELKKFWFSVTTILVLVAMLSFVASGIVSAWRRFKEHDERAFNILKDKDLK